MWIFLIVSLYDFHSIDADPGSNCEFRAYQAESWDTVQQHVVELQGDSTHINKKGKQRRKKKTTNIKSSPRKKLQGIPRGISYPLHEQSYLNTILRFYACIKITLF